VVPPPEPTTWKLKFPPIAEESAAIVSVEDPFPGNGIVDGLKEALTPAGSPNAENETSEPKDPIKVLEIIVGTGVPGTTASAAGEAESEKSEPLWFTVKATVVLLVFPPPDPAIVKV
jgi:hypothetical protein